MGLQTVQAQKARPKAPDRDEDSRKRNDYRVAQTKLLLEKSAGTERRGKKFAETQTRAVEFLKDYGFADAGLAEQRNRFSDSRKLSAARPRRNGFPRWPEGQSASPESIASAVLRPGAPSTERGHSKPNPTLKSQLDKASGLQTVRIGAKSAKLERQAGRR